MKTPALVGLLCTFLAWADPVFGDEMPSLSSSIKADGKVEISWPKGFEAFHLESSSAVGTTAQWDAVVDPPISGAFGPVLTVTPGDRRQFFRLSQVSSAARIIETSPAAGETGVAVTRETILRFDRPLEGTVNLDTKNFYADFGGRRILSRAELSSDRKTATLFYLENLPASSRLRVTFAAQTNETYLLEFETTGTSALPNTGVIGHVYTSELGAGGANVPIVGATITVDGAEESIRSVTDNQGFFRLQPAPAGRFFVHVDGRTAVGSQWPRGAYYPFVGKAWEATPGQTNNPAGGSGVIFLPLIPADALQTISATQETIVKFSAAVGATNSALAGVTVTVPPDALFSDNGARGGKVGIAPVAPDRLPAPLPAGLNLPLVITIQTDGPQNFARPVPVRFPNLPDPVTHEKLPPGAKTVLWSFNHDTGRWEPQGSATITADGNYAETDPGVGVRQPGWHGVAPGSPVLVTPPRIPTPADCAHFDDCPNCVQTVFCKVINKPGTHYALCALKCLGNALKDIFGDGPKPERTPFEMGLRCVGGPERCPQAVEKTLDPARRKCMDECRFPDVGREVYVVPCEGFTNPCKENLPLPLHAEAISQVATENLLPDRFEEQIRFWQVEGEFYIKLTGTPKIIETSSADVPKLSDFFDAFAARVHADTPAGIHLSPEERAELVVMPRPAQFSQAEWSAIIDRLDSIQGNMPADVIAADQALTSLGDLLKQRGWKYRDDGIVHGFLRLSRVRAPAFGSDAFPARGHYFYLYHHQSGIAQRGRLSPAGNFEQMVLSPGGLYSILYLDPVTRRVGAAFFQAAESGTPSVIPTAPLEDLPIEEVDTDGDGLLDVIEEILGTDPALADTDKDGIWDGEEFLAGSNPLDGVAPALGAVTGVNTPGQALDLCAWNDLAAVADADAGIALFDVTNPLEPVLLSQFDTPGNAVSVAASGTLLAVADDTQGVVLLDVSSPLKPVLISQVKLNSGARAVAILEGFVMAGLASGEVVLMSPTGEILQRTKVDNKAVQDLLALNGVLYSLKIGLIESFSLAGGTLVSAGTVNSPGNAPATGRRMRLTGGGTRLFASHAQGYNVFDIALPLAPVPLLQLTTLQFGWQQAVPDGTGLALAAVGKNSTDDGPHDVSLYSIGADAKGTNFITTFPTPGLARALTFYKGVALVADGPSGLTVVRYRTRDFGTNPPSISIHTRFKENATTAESNVRFTFIAEATDDQLVSHVEFYLNDQLVAQDGNYPFEVELLTPARTESQPQFTLRARAFDTAGNAQWSDPLVIDLSKDLVPPAVLAVRPRLDERFLVGDAVPISVKFDEPVVTDTVSTGWRLVYLGADGSLGTSDDSLISAAILQNGPTEYSLAPASTLPVGAYSVLLSSNVTDLAGNKLAHDGSWSFQVQPLLEFVGKTNAIWNSAPSTAKNWSENRVPTISDFVHLSAPGGATVTATQPASAYDLVTETPLIFDNNLAFSLGRRAVFNAPVTLRSFTITGGAMDFRNETAITGSMTTVDQEWLNEGHLIVGPNASINFRNSAGNLTTFRNSAGATWEIIDSQIAVLNLSSGPHAFVNEGLMIVHGTNRTFFGSNNKGSTRFVNAGSVEVRSGKMDIFTGMSGNGASQHLGSYRVDAGASLTFSGLEEFGRDSRLFGTGDVTLWDGTIPGTYEIDGHTFISGTVTFSGPVRGTGPWTITGHANFTGLNPEPTGPFSIEGRGTLSVNVLPQMKLGSVACYSDLDVGTVLEVTGPVQLEGNSQPGVAGNCRLVGTGILRTVGPLTVGGVVNGVGAGGALEIAGMAAFKPNAFFNGSATTVRVLPGGTLDISQAKTVTSHGPLSNEGTILKTDATTSTLGSGFENRGAIRITAGTLQSANFVKSSGLISLTGGNFTIANAFGSGQLSLTGGKLEGVGIVTCASVTNAATVSPGSPIGTLNFQVGTHPVYSVYQQTSAGQLTIDLASTTEYDKVTVSGRALLDGTLELQAEADFDPPLGQEFIILTAAKVEGTFTIVTAANFKPGKRLDVVYSATQVKLVVVTAP